MRSRLTSLLVLVVLCVVINAFAQRPPGYGPNARMRQRRAAAAQSAQRQAAINAQRQSINDAQRQAQRNPAVQRPAEGVGRPVPILRRPPIDQEARGLMRMMLKPLAQYIGVQETVLQENGGTVSEQDVMGDTNGNIRIQFRSPPHLAGDVMIISPGSFHSYHRAKNLLEVAPWPTEWNDEGKRMLANLLNGNVIARLVGTETVAGRTAGMVELTVSNGAGVEGRLLRKLWIDQETGILLRIQKWNARGVLSSSTTMKSISVNPAALITPADFKPQFPGAFVTALFPEPQYRTLQDAQGHLPFAPVEPAPQAIPDNFHLDGVWGFGAERQHPYLNTVLMRFTDGVASFSLYERMVPLGKQGPIERPLKHFFARNQQNWRIQTQQGEMNVQYIGHLTRDQVETMYNSLH